jgi:hypothetical protein
MADIKLSGYKITAQTALTTELNNLANDTWSALSSEIDNTTNLYMMVDIEFLAGGSITPVGADAVIEVYLVPTLDGTNYPLYTASGSGNEQENQQYYVGAITLSLDNEAQRHILRNVELPSGKYKLGVRNKANVSLAASGNTLRWRPWQYSSV